MATLHARTPSCARAVLDGNLRRLLAVVPLLALLVAGAPQVATALSPGHRPKAAAQSVTAAVLPPIAQPGRRTARPAAARSVVTAQVHPGATGRPAILEGRRGGQWQRVAAARLGADGRVSFTAPARVAGHAATYRVRAAAYDGLPAVHSHSLQTDAWGAPAFNDGFTGSALGPRWRDRSQPYNPAGGRSASRGDPSAVAVRNGALRLSVLRDPARAAERFTVSDAKGRKNGSYAYRLNGMVGTQGTFGFRYGVAAARMKFQRRPGQHPSFFLQPTGGMGAGAEVDVVEWFGAARGRQDLRANVYPHPDYESNGSWFGGRLADTNRYLAGADDTWWTGYHVFSVEWTPRHYVFRIDGQETMRTTRGVSHVPEFLILSMLSSDFELGRLGGDARLPQHAYVDWVQVWTEH
jgi:hypothetical protein